MKSFPYQPYLGFGVIQEVWKQLEASPIIKHQRPRFRRKPLNWLSRISYPKLRAGKYGKMNISNFGLSLCNLTITIFPLPDNEKGSRKCNIFEQNKDLW